MTLPATRRTVLLTSLMTTSAVALTTACGGSDDKDSSSSDSTPGTTDLAKTSDIPVGGGKIFKDQKVVVTQPVKGEFKAFSAVCTHQGCTVATVADGTIDCPCHKSMYSITDGAVKGGPAPRPLPVKEITVKGDTITLV
ncbi:Rieske (2Fe-2S) protein [Streptomyces acidiscabies]|uniref:Cytochrome bc1 complex Rieske iron-sulfur subunit n=1 Tax=Streptomyces acidiscabies TaxID=42234 RepID=A0AAP6BH04_9ACTN|nr:Rieske (2Fe-2S) protein [Streptomyces acidiscabies]MBP5940542.1 Rieske (2Fe-2S) protein [Streptomyces sp. LBUM 1476]MBZ3911787.1 Rieske (2Fe-2S) protein [Streptomyces acidiscabies]MDX2964589.1 Rieske (2Fe-2S) protein [Streptomyces acidiscabies]MDX3024499.1 Rieske (2Fe-2S) protein [Streptomyces acidiscabies]MDX3794863.1 Rieske (2Fe-2S) protein [Streptomyces acidiscabies]